METTGTWDDARATSFAERLLGYVGYEAEALPRALLRLVTGTALAYAFGLAASLGAPAPERLAEALAIAAVPLAFAVFYAPSLWVLLTLFDHEIAPGEVARAAVRAVGVTGLVLGGLAPAVAFFELTAGARGASVFAALLEMLALTVGGVLGLRSFVRDVLGAIVPAAAPDSPAAQGPGRSAGLLVMAVAMLGVLLGARFLPTTVTTLHGGFRVQHHALAH